VTDAASIMAGDRSRYGLMVSACGALLLIAAVFLPWYEVALASHTSASAAAGHQLGLISAHRALRDVNVLLLALAALAILDALAPLARGSVGPLPGGAGGSVVLLGSVAAALVLYRMLVPPANVIAAAELSSLREGAWLALLGSLAIALGGIWPRSIGFGTPTAAQAPGAWPGLQG
jgi:hypothetical protein